MMGGLGYEDQGHPFLIKQFIKKTMALYWPIWVCYLLYGLVKVPGVLWFHLRQSNITESLEKSKRGRLPESGN